MALRSAAGFSLIELLIVIAMLLCLIAISLPSVMHSVAALRCRLTMTGLSGVVQQSRSYAIKNNKNMSVHFATSGGQTIAYLEDPSLPPALASAVESKEIALGQGVKQVAKPTGTNAPPELTGTFMWGEDETPSTGDMSFNSRGLPCYWNTTTLKCDAGTDASGNEGYVYYFTYQPPVGENGWSALSVSPAGRIKIWTASGNTWMTN